MTPINPKPPTGNGDFYGFPTDQAGMGNMTQRGTSPAMPFTYPPIRSGFQMGGFTASAPNRVITPVPKVFPPGNIYPGFGGPRMPPPPIGGLVNQAGWGGYVNWLRSMQAGFRTPVYPGPAVQVGGGQPNYWLPPPQIQGLG